MCGVFGFISKDGKRPNLARLQEIAVATETRGQHAFGLAWIDSCGRLKMFKQTGRISDHLGVLGMAADAQMLIGHCRFATHGDPRNNLNNHPHSVDGGWLVHNGVIPNYRDLVKEHSLAPVTECDSEVLGLLVEKLQGSLVERSIGAVQLVEGSALVMLALWRNPKHLVALRRGNPLHMAETIRGTYLASLRRGLPGGAYMLRDETALSFTIRNHQAEMTAFDAAEVLTP